MSPAPRTDDTGRTALPAAGAEIAGRRGRGGFVPWRRCQQMVSGPASRPWPASSLRIKTISSTVSALMAFGEVFGRRDRGSNAASPSAR